MRGRYEKESLYSLAKEDVTFKLKPLDRASKCKKSNVARFRHSNHQVKVLRLDSRTRKEGHRRAGRGSHETGERGKSRDKQGLRRTDSHPWVIHDIETCTE